MNAFGRVLVGVLGAAAGLTLATPAGAGCGCDKPPPARAAVRPFVGYTGQTITLFDDRLVPGQTYDVQFLSTADGRQDSSRAVAVSRRDLADGVVRPQLRVPVGDVSLGPCRLSVLSGGALVYTLGEEQFTVIAQPIALHDFSETVLREGYRTGVGSDGSVYIAVDVSQVSDATTFTGAGTGFALRFGASSVAMYNGQGFLMQLLDPSVPGLFRITPGDVMKSDMLSYWRHEFRTYKQKHRQVDAFRLDADPDWHADGTYHVDHDHIVVAIAGGLVGGVSPAPGATAPFTLTIVSSQALLN